MTRIIASKLALSLKLLAHLRKKAADPGRSQKTKAALASMIRVQERVVEARSLAED